MKKIFLIILSFFIMCPIVSAVDNVDYKVDGILMDASIEISGNLLVKEVIKVSGSYNGYIRDLIYSDNVPTNYTLKKEDFYGSNIYNPTNISIRKVGLIDYDKDLDFDIYNEEVKEFNECSDSKLCYTTTNMNNTLEVKMYNETINSSTYFYIEYLVENLVVMHNDIAEIYYNFIGNDFLDEIGVFKLRLALPYETKEQIKVWAHGPLNGEVSFITNMKDSPTYYGAYLSIDKIDANTPVDLRMTFPTSLILVTHPYLKKSNMEALPYILEVEEERAEEANKERQRAKLIVYSLYGTGISYILLTIIILIIIYIKFDKELKSDFHNEYNREFIDDYDVTVIEYLMDKKITEKAFTTSILNLIYKKKIKYEQTGKKDFTFIKVSEEGLTNAEKEVMNILFNEAGNKKEVKLKDLQNYAKKIVNDYDSPFLNSYNKWQSEVLTDSINQEFYVNYSHIKAVLSIYGVIGIILFIINLIFNVNVLLTILIFIFTVFYFIYLITFTKRTKKGNDHYTRWKAFKKFLLDFGLFNEKELPEITLWERYLVYASIFGIADTVSKTMKIKFNEINPNTDSDIFYNYVLYSNIRYNLNTVIPNVVSSARKEVASAKAIYNSNNSSGGGFGGGFSSGGGFGGGGGGGRGF